MSVDTTLDTALTILLSKAQVGTSSGPVTQPTGGGGGSSGGGSSAPSTLPATVNMQFGGGGAPIVLANTDPSKASVPFAGRIAWARLCAGDATGRPVAVTATVDVQLTSFETFGASTSLSGSGTSPSLQTDSVRDCDLTGWHLNLVTGDWLIARLLSFSGSATWIALEMLIRPTDVPIGVAGVVDANGDQIVDNNGNPIVVRN